MAKDKEIRKASDFFKSENVTAFLKAKGKTLLKKGSDVEHLKISRIPTGIFPLDYGLGGGFPAGRVSLVYGPRSSTKSTTLLRALGQAQKMCSTCWTYIDDGKCSCGEARAVVAAYIDAEGAYKADWAAVHGVNTEDLIWSQPEYGELALDTLEFLLKSGECDLVVLDSLAFLTPIKEMEESHEKDTMASQARMIGKGMRKLVACLNLLGNDTGRRPTVLFCNQQRQKVGIVYGSNEVQSGGLATGYATSVEVKFGNGKYEVEEGDDGIKRPLHVDVNFKIEKNKVSKPRIEGTYRMLLADNAKKTYGQLADEALIINMAERVGIAKKLENSTKWECMGETFRGKGAFEEYLEDHIEFKAKLANLLFKMEHGHDYEYRWF